MIKLKWVAEIILSIFYAGRVKSDKKLAIEDFEQAARLAYADIMRRLYYQAKQDGDEFDYFGYQLEEPKRFTVGEKDFRGRRSVKLEDAIMRLPRNLGVFNIWPVHGGEEEKHIRIIETGAENIFRGEDFEDISFAVIKGKRIDIYNLHKDITEVEVEGIFNKDDQEIPLDIAWEVLNQVLGVTLKVQGFPVDKTNDGDPNVTTFKNRLAEKQTV